MSYKSNEKPYIVTVVVKYAVMVPVKVDDNKSEYDACLAAERSVNDCIAWPSPDAQPVSISVVNIRESGE